MNHKCFENILYMIANCCRAYAKLAGDLSRTQTMSHQEQDVPLARRQRR
jgi:hypothetical protein